MAVLSNLNAQGSTIVMITHEDDIAAYAQRVIHFLDGGIVTDEPNGHPSRATVRQEESYESV